jgi:hypothetical protein
VTTSDPCEQNREALGDHNAFCVTLPARDPDPFDHLDCRFHWPLLNASQGEAGASPRRGVNADRDEDFESIYPKLDQRVAGPVNGAVSQEDQWQNER